MWTRKIFYIEGMTCSNCETEIEKALMKINGIKQIKANFLSSSVSFIYNDKTDTMNEVIRIIEEAGYSIKNNEENIKRKVSVICIFISAIVLYFLYNMMKPIM